MTLRARVRFLNACLLCLVWIGPACQPNRRLEITLPATTSAVVGSTVAVNYRVVGSSTGVDHVHFRLDGGPELMDPAPVDGVFQLTGVAPGPHTLDGFLVSADHARIAGTDAATVSFYVAPNATDPAVIGRWSEPVPLPTVAVDLILLHTGKVLFWAGEFATAPNFGELWDPATNEITHVPNPFSNIFCSSHVALADGRILVAGGHDQQNGVLGLAKTNTFDPVTESWTALPSLAFRRWYPTLTLLGDGRAIINSGSSFNDSEFVDTPEVYDPVANTWTALTDARLSIPQYPMMFLLPDGRLLQTGSTEYATATRALDFTTRQWTTVDARVLEGGSAAMYAPGRIVKAGSGSADGTTPTATSSGETYVLDMTAPSPAWRQTASLAFARTFHNITMLPDGTALATGGSQRKSETNLTPAVLAAELWSPATESWSTLAPMTVPRIYHGSAVLLPDGRVAVAGGGNIAGATDMLNAEIFSPPYLFKGPRPVVSATPSLLRLGTSFAIRTPDAGQIRQVSLVRPGAATHAFDQDQRFIPLSFARSGTDELLVWAPTSPHVATPGYYMLFVVSAGGVPSVASFVRIPAPYEDSVPPTSPSGLAASGAPGAVNLSWSPATDDVGPVTYRIHRSPTPGVPATPSTLVASTTTTSYRDAGLAPGAYSYVVVASDPVGNLSAASNEVSASVPADPVPPTVVITAPRDGDVVQGLVGVTASASDDVGVAGVQFRLDGAPLGPEDTAAPFSYAWNTIGVAAGSHVLTAVARDAANNTAQSIPVQIGVSGSQPVAGLVAAYGFEEGSGATTADTSGNDHTGAVSGAAWSPAGRSGGALSFDGLDDRVTVADANALDLTDGMTLEAWVRPAAAAAGWRTVIMKEGASDLAYGLYADSPDAGPEGYVAAGGTTGVFSATALPLDAWSHLALTYDGTTLRLYVNGNQVATQAKTGSMAATTGPLRIGGNAIWGEYFAGLIDDVRVYDRPLTPAEIAADRDGAGLPAPRLVITAPVAGSAVAGSTVSVAYGVTGDPTGVGHVHFRLDGGPELIDLGPIDGVYQLTGVGLGSHALEGFLVRADHSKIAGSDADPVAFTVSAADTTAPTVVITAPRDGDVVQGLVTVTATASDNLGVAGVQFRLDGAPLGPEDTAAPFSYAWNTAGVSAGSHVLTAVARDAANNTAQSIAVRIGISGSRAVAGLVAAYGFEEGSGATTADASGNGHTGAVSGAAWSPAGRSGGALSFDGLNDQVTIADAPALDLTNGMTLEAWVRPAAAAAGWHTVIMKESASDLAYGLYADSPDAGPEGYVAAGGTTGVFGPTALPLDAWSHLALTYDGTTLRLYVNGNQVASQAKTGSMAATAGPLRIGRNAIWGEPFAGLIDDVRIYDRPLTPAEIAADRDAAVLPHQPPTRSSPIVVDPDARRVWVVNPDNDSVSAVDADSLALEFEIPVGRHPTGLALDGFGQLWVTCREDDSVWVLDALDGTTRATLTLPWGSAPTSVVFAPTGVDGYVAAQGSGRIHRVQAITRSLGASLALGPTPRALAVTGDGQRLLVTQLITSDGIGRVRSVSLSDFTAGPLFELPMDLTSQDGSIAARGVANYLAGIAIDPRSDLAWIVAKKDNVIRGLARDGQALTFETTVRAITTVIDLEQGQELPARRLDLDNLSQPSALAFSESGDHLFLTVQGSNQLLALNGLGLEVTRAETGRAPQGVALDPTTGRVFTHDFMGRTVSVFDASALLSTGTPTLPRLSQVQTVSAEALAPTVLRGKQIFYDASDPRMSRDGYLSCAACHLDGGHDGQVWDFTDRGEGLRNTASLQGQGGGAGAPLHWSGNFDEVQDFEGDIRSFFLGTGLMSDADYLSGIRSQPLGDPKQGLSSDLDALAAYVDSLTTTSRSPHREPDGAATADAVAGASLFAGLGCASCHSGPRFSDTNTGLRHDVGTIKPSSGQRLGGPLDGIDTPLLPGLATTAPYLHDGSAATVLDVLTTANPDGRHGNLGGLSPAQRNQLVEYLLQLEIGPPPGP